MRLRRPKLFLSEPLANNKKGLLRMEIYLMRHGTPYSVDEDPQKSLNNTGVKECAIAGKTLIRLGVDADLVVSSSKKRALQTAEIISEAIGYAKDKIVISPVLAPQGFPKDVISFLEDFQDKRKVLIVGHLPLLENLVYELINNEQGISVCFTPASLCLIEIEKIVINSGTLRWFLTQKQLKFIAYK